MRKDFINKHSYSERNNDETHGTHYARRFPLSSVFVVRHLKANSLLSAKSPIIGIINERQVWTGKFWLGNVSYQATVAITASCRERPLSPGGCSEADWAQSPNHGRPSEKAATEVACPSTSSFFMN